MHFESDPSVNPIAIGLDYRMPQFSTWVTGYKSIVAAVVVAIVIKTLILSNVVNLLRKKLTKVLYKSCNGIIQNQLIHLIRNIRISHVLIDIKPCRIDQNV